MYTLEGLADELKMSKDYLQQVAKSLEEGETYKGYAFIGGNHKQWYAYDTDYYDILLI